ncbi:hypothetical protein BS47DRAFT_1361642 [Hydnum rufescens UP504]|uniref:Glyoxalase-like domain-containing protein n=1 Tax=Hydnum rufescens UP504 TaxID=1448309 RepID=A0A9P6DY03_9AGAM|nr:hypothetical protein BS47DRAFT_1361642 [Hydnum rufescens UP504]
MVERTDIQDHIIYLAPPGQLDIAIERFSSLGFKFPIILPARLREAIVNGIGGRTSSPAGSIMALLGLDQFVGEVINKRAGRTLYSPPANGGRTRPDGVELEWRVTFPERGHEAGVLPFFCEDITPRDLRVPSEPPGNTAHPSSATGIAYVKLLSPTGLYAGLVDQLNAVIGSKPLSSSPSETSWEISTLSGDPQHVTRLILSVRDESGDVPTSGIIEVGFWVDKGRGGPAGDGPLGHRVVWVQST